MSLSDFHLSVTKEKSESSLSKMANCSSDLPYMHDEFVELLWDNGPVTTNRPRKFKDNPYPKIGNFKTTEPKLNNFQYSGLNAQDDDIVPWLNYPIEDEDPLRNNYCSDFLDDYSIHSQSTAVPRIKSKFSEGAMRDSHNAEQERASDISIVRENELFQLPPSTKLSEIDVINGSSTKTQKENDGNSVVNFSHFSRPVTLASASLQCVESNKKAALATGSNPRASTAIESAASGVKCGLVIQDQLSSVQPNGDMISSPKANNHDHTNTSSRLSEAIVRDESEKANEAVVASSSGCSGSSAWERRKSLEGEESTYKSEDLEGESEDLKKPSNTQGKSKKRSRAAEVHNQSERRRRDRINERMHALQELIPNCNKTDKASMLDEAIEYLKSLQMQVQIMSMGSGLCMPPMMMQHIGASMPHFAPMGMGMGIGLNYGMGHYDMNGSPRCPFIQVPPIQGPHFPYPSFQGPPRPGGLQVFGFPRPMPYQPPTSSLADAKTSTVVYAKSENHHQQSNNSEKMERSDSRDFKS